MAFCSNPQCGKNVGCGCKLTNGLCAACYAASIAPTKPKQ